MAHVGHPTVSDGKYSVLWLETLWLHPGFTTFLDACYGLDDI